MDHQSNELPGVVLRVEVFCSPEKLRPLDKGQQPDSQSLAFELVLNEYLSGLVTDLGLGIRIDLKVEWLSEKVIAAGPGFQVFINEQRCRMPLKGMAPSDINHRQLAFQVADIVSRNSALLLPESLSDALRKQWSTGKEPFLSVLDSRSFNSLLVALVRRGHSVAHARKVQTVYPADSSWPDISDAIFEEAVQAGPQSPLALLLPLQGNDPAVTNAGKISALQKQVQDSIFFGLGLQLPEIEMRFDKQLGENEFCLRVNDLRQPPVAGPYPGELFVELPADDLALFEIKGRPALHPLTGAGGTIVSGGREQIEKLSAAGFKSVDYWDVLAQAVEAAVQQSAGSLLTTAIVQQRIESLQRHAPNLVNIVASRFPNSQLVAMMRELLDETISIRDLRTLFEGLASLNGTTSTDPKYITFPLSTSNFVPVENGATLAELTITDYSNWLRVWLHRSISHKFTTQGNLLLVLLLTQEMEARLRRVDDEPLAPEETESFHQAIRAEVEALFGHTNFVILTTVEVRRRLRRLIEIEFPRLAVLCYQELSQDLTIQSLARIST